MSSSSEILAKKIDAALVEWGAKAKLQRDAGISHSQLERYRDKRSDPTLATLDRLAEGMGFQPWELIKPEGASPTPGLSEDVIILAKRIERLDPAHRGVVLKAIEMSEELTRAKYLFFQGESCSQVLRLFFFGSFDHL